VRGAQSCRGWSAGRGGMIGRPGRPGFSYINGLPIACCLRHAAASQTTIASPSASRTHAVPSGKWPLKSSCYRSARAVAVLDQNGDDVERCRIFGVTPPKRRS
jgi:hypothetical protein